MLGVLPFNVQQQPLTIYSTRTWQLHQPLTNGATHVQPLIEELLPSLRAAKVKSKMREEKTWVQNERRANVSAIERKRERGVAAMGSSPCCHCSNERWELSGCDPPPCIYCILSLSLIKWTSLVDVGGFAEPHKILCVSVLTLRWAIISTSPVGFPNIW